MLAAAPLLLLHAICWWPLVLFLLLPPLPLFALITPPTFTSLYGSELNHLLLDSSSGYVYVGAVNALYHLSPDLQLISWGKTGPTLDSPNCLPPIEPKDCSQARQTDNTNQLLLLEKQEGIQAQSLIVCGTVLQGICEKRNLANVSQVLYHTANPVDTQYVAANDPRVSTVAVLTEHKGTRLMLVGRGFTSKGPGGISPITTRRLEQYRSSPAFSHEELGKLVVGSYSEYNNQFVKVLHHGTHIYFLFSRRDTLKTRDYHTYISRLCDGDPSFYSYVEVPLSCTGGYNLAQAATMGTYLGRASIFVAMAKGQASTNTPTERSALCLYSMEELDKALDRAQFLCYTQEGKGVKEHEAYIPYEVPTKCLKLPSRSVTKYPCGGEHTPSPIASAVPLQATPANTWATQLSAVAVATEAGNTIALLGDKSGQLYKVFVHVNGSGSQYDLVKMDPKSPVKADLLLDSTLRSVYIMTEKKVTRLPVAQCEKYSDCRSCLSVRDPYCGWCSLEGRCTRKMECTRHSQPHHWLWSYGHDRQCVSIQSLDQEQTQFCIQEITEGQ
ncbi:plexin-B1-like isoform X2 [Silurus meridionalis]|uniref:plexin-B1-like isoform X2 n=1 Tax=Silurus meridionalis TaxID=175797 RepID=UPI001EEC93AA|nr:plexin-B1-like isoform X2 [Silurus meridionalis]